MKDKTIIMSVRRKYTLGVINDEYAAQFESIVSKYATRSTESSSHMYFGRQPINSDEFSQDVLFFQLEGESESMLDKKVNDLIGELNEFDADYVLGDDETGELLVTVSYGGQIVIKFDNVDFIEKGTFKKIDELKVLRTDYGYCRGYKPIFRPIEGNHVDSKNLQPEVIYILANSGENLLKLRDFLTEKVKAINPDFKVEFTWFFKDE